MVLHFAFRSPKGILGRYQEFIPGCSQGYMLRGPSMTPLRVRAPEPGCHAAPGDEQGWGAL